MTIVRLYCAVAAAAALPRLKVANPLRAPRRSPLEKLKGVKITKQHAALGIGIVQALLQARRAKHAAPGDAAGDKHAFAVESSGNVVLDDVKGNPEAVAALRDVSDFVRDAARFEAVGARPPRGVLLYGPPGCGKTLLAKALARETNATFYSCSGSSFVEVYSGLGAKRVRELFADARKRAPSVVFVDEIDALARARSGGGPGGGGSDEREQALNQLLCELDGFGSDPDKPVVVVAATNRKELLDEAAVRAGRFDRHVRVVKPDEAARLAILRGVKGPKLGAGVADATLPKVAALTRGSSGAELAALMNDASIRAARRRAAAVEERDVLAAFDAVAHGGEPMAADKFEKLAPAVKRRVATHEAGHALAALVDQPAVEVEATIVPRSSGSGGHVLLREPTDGDELPTRASLRARLRVALAGREAEAIALGDDHVSVGAASDLEVAQGLARLLARMGFCAEADSGRGGPAVTEQRADATAAKFLERERVAVHRLLTSRRGALRRLADALMEHSTLDHASLRAIVDDEELRMKHPVRRWLPAPRRKQVLVAA